MRRAAFTLAVVSAALTAPAAEAAHVAMYRGSPNTFGVPESTLIIGEYTGEVNDLTIVRAERITVRDAAAPLTTDSELCRQVDTHTVSCDRGTDDLAVDVNAGPLDDRVEFRGYFATTMVSARGGADEVRGGDGSDTIFGGVGDDRIYGGAGSDYLVEHDDYYGTRSSGSGLLDGGGGTDTVSYLSREQPVRVDLTTPVGAGAPGEDDRPVRIENIVGGDNVDRLLGTSGPNMFLSNGDRVFARAGDDTIRVTGSATSPPLLGCGEGSDTVDFLNVKWAWGPVDLSQCERISESEGDDPYAGRPIPGASPLGSVGLRARLLERGRLRLPFRHRPPSYVRLYRAGYAPRRATLLGEWRGTGEFVIRLTRRGRRELRGRRRFRALIHLGWASKDETLVYGPRVLALIRVPRPAEAG